MTRRPLLLVKAIHFSDPVGVEDLVQNELEFLASPHSRVKESDLALGRSCPADGEAASRVKLLVSRIIYTKLHSCPSKQNKHNKQLQPVVVKTGLVFRFHSKTSSNRFDFFNITNCSQALELLIKKSCQVMLLSH